MKTLKARVCHTDIPSATGDSGESIRQAAAESCGFRQGQDLFDAQREIEAGGGAEGILDAVVRRIERGDSQ
jgi:hypothetical protein